MSLRVLLDTKIFIDREDSQEVNQKLSKIIQILNKENYTICVNENTKNDLINDKHNHRKKECYLN